MASVSAVGEDGALGLLQRGAAHGEKVKATSQAATEKKRQRQMPNATRVWENLKAAVTVDKLKEQVKSAVDSATGQKIQEHVMEIEKAFPYTQTIKASFQGDWQDISDAVDVEELDKQLKETLNSEEAQGVREKLKSLKAKMGNVSLESVEDKAAATWAKLQDRGLALPDLDSLTENAEALANRASNAVSAAMNSDYVQGAKDTFGKMASSVGGWLR